MCEHHYEDDPVGMLCNRQDPHTKGHTYATSSGSDVPDRHDATSGGEH